MKNKKTKNGNTKEKGDNQFRMKNKFIKKQNRYNISSISSNNSSIVDISRYYNNVCNGR
jgi:hypothetical protein